MNTLDKKSVIGIIVLVLVIGGGLLIWDLASRPTPTAVQPILSVAAFDQTQGLDAASAGVLPQDIIAITFNAQNPSNQMIRGYAMRADISGLSQNSTLVDAAGASYDVGTNSLVWTPLDISPNQTVPKKILVRIAALPSGATSAVMTVKFNNELKIMVGQIGATATPAANPSAAGASFHAPDSGTDGREPLILGLLAVGAFLLARKLLKFKK